MYPSVLVRIKYWQFFPKESMIKRTINNHKAIPPIELVGMTAIGQLPESHSRTLGENPQLFLKLADWTNFCNTVYRKDNNAPLECRPLVFASQVELRTLSFTMTCYMDGKFVIAPKQLKQVFIVRVVLSQVPVAAAYALLPPKRSLAYRECLGINLYQWCKSCKPWNICSDQYFAKKNLSQNFLKYFPRTYSDGGKFWRCI